MSERGRDEGPRDGSLDERPRLPRDAVELARRLRADVGGQRRIIGVVGAPGAGKSTLAEELVAALGEEAVHVPMDGFHLADVQLRARGLLEAKGAPATFDSHGYARLLATLRQGTEHTVFAPGFEREIEQPLAAAIAVEPEHRFVVTEGNYLLLDGAGWPQARDAIDVLWYVRLPDAVRKERLVARHVRFGKSPERAARWVEEVDEPNARLVIATAARADAIIDGA